MAPRDIKQRVLPHLAEAACQWHRTARKNGLLRVVAVPLGEGPHLRNGASTTISATQKERGLRYFPEV